ncbi:hypothetical protein KR084_009806 [Drosophila pseudotakahashii]|nr:hypothetical protein KR084_009806 [Drosophila pseudotakahashii]
MGKKFCYSELKTATQAEMCMETRKSRRQGNRNGQLGKDHKDTNEEEDKPPQSKFFSTKIHESNNHNFHLVKGVLDNLANGYLKLVHQMQDNLRPPPPPPSIELEEKKREMGGEMPKSPMIEEELSQSSEDGTQPGIGFVDLYRRSLHFECLGIPLTPLELYSMERQRCKTKELEMSERILGGFRTNTEKEDPLRKDKDWDSRGNLPSISDGRRNPLENTFELAEFSEKQGNPNESGSDGEEEPSVQKFSSIELAQYSPKFQSRFLGNFHHSKPTKISSSRHLAHYPSKSAIRGGKKRLASPENRKIYKCSEVPGNTCCSPKKKVNVSKMCLNSRWLPCSPESKPHHRRGNPMKGCPVYGTSNFKETKLETLLPPRRLKDCRSGSETHLIGFRDTKTPSLEVFDKRLTALLKSEPKKSCLKKSADQPIDDFDNPDDSDSQSPIELHSNDTFTEVWKKSELGLAIQGKKAKPGQGGLYSRADKLRFQPLDRLDAECAGLPLFKNSDETLERTQYFVTEFDKLSRAEKMEDMKLRMGQLRWLQTTSDRKYREYFRDRKINFMPVQTNAMKYACPADEGQCSGVSNATLLGHFLSQHLDESGIELREIFEDQRVLMIFSPKDFELGQNTCVSVIVYGGQRGRPSTLPAERFMPARNTELPEAYRHFNGHLPLFVMICRNRLSQIEGAEEGRSVRFEDEDALALWMVSMNLPLPVHVVMTVINRRLDITRSSIMKVRGLHMSHNCLDFMQHSQQYMRLSDRDLRVLTNDHTEPIYMEIAVKEYAGIFPSHR